jgi:hypothetical protein
MKIDTSVSILSALQSNETKDGFTEIREGFITNPNVGSITHEFTFKSDPWTVPSTAGATLIIFRDIKLSVTKVFNPLNHTDLFYALTWTPEYHYSAGKDGHNDYPECPLKFMDNNYAKLESVEKRLEFPCNASGRQSLTSKGDPDFFDRIAHVSFTLPPWTWIAC